MNKFQKLGTLLAVAGMGAVAAHADVIADANALVDDAETTFNAVAAVILLVVAFGLVKKFVSKLRGA